MYALACDAHTESASARVPLTQGAQPKKDNDESQQFTMGDKAVLQLLTKLDEGSQTIANLRSILTFKTAELNELIAHLEITNQAIHNVETSTTQIESMLREMGISEEMDPTREAKLMDAGACLDSAIKSASSLYTAETQHRYAARRSSMTSNESSSTGMDLERRDRLQLRSVRSFGSKIRYKPDTKHILRQLNELLRHLELDSGKFFEGIGTTDDVQALQKAYVDLDIAKTIALSAKNNLRRRTILLRSARRRDTLEQIKILGCKIREGEALWRTYARNAPMIIEGKDVIAVLDREDDLLAKNLPVHPMRMSIDGQSKRPSLAPLPSANAPPLKSSVSIRSCGSASSVSWRDMPGPHLSSDRGDSCQSADSSSSMRTAIPAVIQSPTAMTNRKALHRATVGGRLSTVKVGTSSSTRARVGTAAHKKDQSTSTSQHTRTTSKPREISSIPVPTVPAAVDPIPTPTDSDSDAHKKSILSKTNPQRGPGSTLRLRSMLAKRHPSVPVSLKPPSTEAGKR